MLSPKMTYSQWLTEWREVYKKPKLSPNSLWNLDILVRKHIPDFIKEMPLDQISAFEIQKALNMIEFSRTREGVFMIYGETFRRLYGLGVLPRNPMDMVDKIKHARHPGKALSHEELAAFLSAINQSNCRRLFLFYLYTGARRSEAVRLQWRHIDFDADTVLIPGTKTEQSYRTIPLFPPLRSLLSEIPRKDDFVFHITADYATREFKRLCPAHHLHDLRHTFATRCLECGISIKVVQKWLGHSRLDTTASIYTHVQDTFVKAEALKFKLY